MNGPAMRMLISQRLVSQVQYKMLSSSPAATRSLSRNASCAMISGQNQLEAAEAWPTRQLHIRSMVTVTKTSVSELNIPPAGEAIQNLSSSNPVTLNRAMTSEGDQQLVHVTKSCINRIKQLASKRPHPENIYLRVFVDAGGCSGFQYKFELEDETDNLLEEDEDIVFTPDASDSTVRIVVDKDSLELLKGSTIDFVQEMIKSSFAVTDNPQSEKACGCGSSFAVKSFQANPTMD